MQKLQMSSKQRQSTQSVKMVVCLWKRSHNLFSQRLCRFPQLNTTVG